MSVVLTAYFPLMVFAHYHTATFSWEFCHITNTALPQGSLTSHLLVPHYEVLFLQTA